jgi:hypothetical protein
MTGGAVQYPPVARVVFCAERVRAAQARSGQGLTDDLAKAVALAERDQSSEGALAVRRSRVEKDAGHGLITPPGVDAFGDARGAVAAFQSEFPDHRVGERMQQDVAHAGPVTCGQPSVGPPGFVSGG